MNCELTAKADSTDSDIIHLLRFPLALMVVFLHADPNIAGWDVVEIGMNHWWADGVCFVITAISNVLAHTAVPLFFLISGFLFFRNFYSWDSREWKRKIKARLFTILIPYILWVAIFTAVHLLRNCPANLSTWLSDQGGLLSIFWNSQNWIAGGTNVLGQRIMMSGPYAFHLWFLRDLMVAFALTPIFYYVFARRGDNGIRRSSMPIIALLGVLYLLQVQTTLPGLSFSTIFYFGLGCFLSLNKLSLTILWYRYKYVMWIAFGILLILLTLLNGANTQHGSMLMPLFTLVGCIAILNFAACWIQRGKRITLSLKYEDTSFFLFIIHPFFLGLVWTVLTRLVSMFIEFDGYIIAFIDSYPILAITIFIIKVAMATAISVLTYRLSMIAFPKVMKILCGR